MSHDKQDDKPERPVEPKQLAEEFLLRWQFYGLHRFFSKAEREVIVAALRRPLLEPVPTPSSAELHRKAPHISRYYFGGADQKTLILVDTMDSKTYTLDELNEMLASITRSAIPLTQTETKP
jgi:hypothetical protein